MTHKKISIREHNLSQILNLIWQRGSIFRTEISSLTGLSATTISALVNILLEQGFLQEVGMGQSSGGRKPIELQFNYRARFAIGVDIGASHVTTILMDLQGQIEQRITERLDVIQYPDKTMDNVRQSLEQILEAPGLQLRHILGIGVTVPTPLDGEKRDRLATYYMPAWEGIAPIDELSHSLPGLPIYLENDANAGAIAEKWWGKGKNYSSLAYIKLGVGVGGGLVIDNEIYRGFYGIAGELGHTTIVANGRICRCGNYGCMECYVGAPGILTDIVNGYAEQGNNPMGDDINIEKVIRRAQEGDSVCRTTIQKAGAYLGTAIANLINLVNPGIVVLGGELTDAGDLLMDEVRSTVRKRVFLEKSRLGDMTISQLGDSAVSIGAATLAIYGAFQEEEIYRTLGLE